MGQFDGVFSSILLLRILLPGLVLWVGLYPLLSSLPFVSEVVGLYPVGAATAVLVGIVFFGLVAYASTLPTYHLLHGEILPWVTGGLRRWNRARVKDAASAVGRAYGDARFDDLGSNERKQIQKLMNYLSDFPIQKLPDGSTEYSVKSATRLGSIIDTYLTYPDTRYGVSGIDFWAHFSHAFPEHVHRDLGRAETLAHGMVMTAAACIASAASLILLGLGGFVGILWPLFTSPLTDGQLLSLLLLMTASGLLFIALARTAHRQFGRQFRAAFDFYADDFAGWVVAQRMPYESAICKRSDEIARYSHHLETDEIASDSDEASSVDDGTTPN